MGANIFIILYWFCHTSTWICHRCTRVPYPEHPSHLPPRNIPLGHPSAPAPSILYHAPNLVWWFVSYIILYMFQCHSPKSSHPFPLPQSPNSKLIKLTIFFSFMGHAFDVVSKKFFALQSKKFSPIFFKDNLKIFHFCF